MSSTATFSIIVTLTTLTIGALIQGHRFQSWLVSGETTLRQASRPNTSPATLLTPPLLVQNYLRLAVKNPQRLYHHVEFKQTGRFWLKADGPGLPFTAQQVVSIGQPRWRLESGPFTYFKGDITSYIARSILDISS